LHPGCGSWLLRPAAERAVCGHVRWFLVARCSGDRSALRDCLNARRRRYDATLRTLTVVLITIDDDFDSSDEVGLEHLATDDGKKACQAAYESAKG
jgi:hypothetical protein